MLKYIQGSSLAFQESKSASLHFSDDIALFHLSAVIQEYAEVNVSAG